jgi:hypothetical protein
MKRMKSILLALLLVASLLASTGVASAKTHRINFSGSEWCDPATVNIGSVRQLGPNLQVIKLISQTCYDTASVPQLTGTDYLKDAKLYVLNGNLFKMNGNLRMESSEGGAWEGHWVMPANSTTIQVTAHGKGLYKGMELHWFLSLESDATGNNTFWGYIENPHN